jgi:hypothetical protein
MPGAGSDTGGATSPRGTPHSCQAASGGGSGGAGASKEVARGDSKGAGGGGGGSEAPLKKAKSATGWGASGAHDFAVARGSVDTIRGLPMLARVVKAEGGATGDPAG